MEINTQTYYRTDKKKKTIVKQVLTDGLSVRDNEVVSFELSRRSISSTNLKVVTTPLLTVVICHKHFINSSLCIWTEVLEITVVVVLLIIVVL